jgi:hypothetical protein
LNCWVRVVNDPLTRWWCRRAHQAKWVWSWQCDGVAVDLSTNRSDLRLICGTAAAAGSYRADAQVTGFLLPSLTCTLRADHREKISKLHHDRPI